MPIIRTVTGDIDPSVLGMCLPHEHLLGGPPSPEADPDFTLDSEAAAVKELNRFHGVGGRALVEMSPIDYRRNVAGLKRISEATSVHVICTSGQHKQAFSRPWVENITVDELAARFVAEVNSGIDGTDIRAGVIKAASSLNDISPLEERVFRAAAAAHQETGASISTHTEAGTMGLEQVKLLRSLGVDPSSIIIGHVDRKLEWAYHLALARTGVYLCYDQLSKEKYYPDAQRVEFIVRLVQEGHGKQLLLSSDLARRSYWPSYGTGGGPGLSYTLWRFVPWLRSEGLDAGAIDDLLTGNPARALTLP